MSTHQYVLDDFGLSPELDRLVADSVDASVFDRISVMPGLYDLTPLLPWLSKVPKIDIHLSLTEFDTRTWTMRKSSKDFLRRAGVVKRFLQGRYTQRNVSVLWRRQVRQFEHIFNRVPDGINSHEHVHFYPPFFKIAAQIAKEKKIPYVRLGEKLIPLHGGMRDWFHTQTHQENLKALERYNLETSSALASFDRGMVERDLLQYPKGTEVILHADLPANLAFITKRLKKKTSTSFQ